MESGASVSLWDRDEALVKKTAQKLSSKGNVEAVVMEVSDLTSVENAVKSTQNSLGSIDILVCNAATNPVFGSLSNLPDQAFEKLVKVNIQSTLWLSQLVIPQMVESGGGSIILLSSIAAIRGNAFIGAYGMTKAAESALARNLAVEYGPSNVRVNAIAPGFIETDMTDGLPDDQKEALASQIPMGRLGTADEIAQTVLFLAGDSGSYITGQTLHVNGGMYTV